MTEPTRQELLELASAMAQASESVLKLAHNEKNASTKKDKGAAHFLKLNGQRLGRDIELYGFMGEGPIGWQNCLPMFLEEIVLPLRKTAPDAYKKASDVLKDMGKRVYPLNVQLEWEKLFV